MKNSERIDKNIGKAVIGMIFTIRKLNLNQNKHLKKKETFKEINVDCLKYSTYNIYSNHSKKEGKYNEYSHYDIAVGGGRTFYVPYTDLSALPEFFQL